MRRLACTLLAALGVLPVFAEERPSIDVRRVSRAPTLEDFLSMRPPADLSASMTHVDGGFVQRTPVEGDPASRHTDVYLGYDDNLYAVFVAFEDQPDRIRANLSRREDLLGDDIVEIQLDTFADQRRAYTFICNPLGVQFDAIWIEGRDFDITWDTAWSSRGRLTDRGYVVWMAIPFKSLRFPAAEEQRWGFLLGRDTPADNEETFFPPLSTAVEGRLNQAGTLRGLRDISPGRNIQLIPYATARSFKVLDRDSATFVEDDSDVDAGIDAKFVFRDSLVLDVTVNPDFSQVESDEPQITVNERFEVFFPEKRPFFLENASFFQTPPPRNLVFTRRIGEPRVGARLTGKLGDTNIGLLLIDDEAPGKALPPSDPLARERAEIGIVRVSRDIAAQSNVGVIYTERTFGDRYNRVGGFDMRIKLNDNWVAQGLAVNSRTRMQDGSKLDDTQLEYKVDRNGRHLNVHIHRADIGRDFVTDLGFVPRTDIRDIHSRVGWTFRPEGKRLLTWTPAALVQHIEDHDGLTLETTANLSLDFGFRRQTALNLSAGEIDVTLRPSDVPNLAVVTKFETRSWGLGGSSRPINAVRLSFNVNGGKRINFRPNTTPPELGDALTVRAGLTLRPLDRLAIDNTYIHNTLDAPGGAEVFANTIVRSRWSWQFNRQMSIRLIGQYDSLRVDPALTTLERDKRVNLDFLFTYLVNPWTALYVGYNGNRANVELVPGPGGTVVRTDDADLTDGRQLFVKLSYLLRF